MVANFHIKPAGEADVELVHGLIRGLAEYERLLQVCRITQTQLRDALFGAQRCAEAIIAYEGDEAIGFALFLRNFSTFVGRPGIYLEDLFVKPEHRGKGYGKRLLAHIARIAVERNCWRVEWVVLDWNEQAQGFYKNLGAMALDDWQVYRLSGGELDQLAATAR